MPSAVNMQLTHFLKPHSFSRCCLLLLGLSIKRGYRIGGFALRPSGEVLFVLFEMAAHEELP